MCVWSEGRACVRTLTVSWQRVHPTLLSNKFTPRQFSFLNSVVDPWHFGTGSGSPDLYHWHRSGSGTCFFRQWLTRCQQRNEFFLKFLCLLLFTFQGTFTAVFKDKKSKRCRKIVKNKSFSYFFCLLVEGSWSGSGTRSGSKQIMMDPHPGGPKTCGSYGSGSTTLLLNIHCPHHWTHRNYTL